MNNLFKKTRSLVFFQQKSIFSSAFIISAMIILSSLVGFLRYRTLSHYFVKEELDLFLAAFRIPDLIFEIVITGAFTSSFIPIFIKYQNDKEKLSLNISSIINLIFLASIFFIIICLLFLKPIINLITPGFNQEKINTIIYFSRVLLIGQLPFFILGNFLTALSQSQKNFILPSLAPVIYNLSIIIVTIIFANSLGLKAPLLGVCLGGGLFFLIQLPILKKRLFSYQLIIKKTKGLIEFFRMIVPRTLTVIVSQIDATIDLSLTSLLNAGAYTIFYFAQRLQLLPISVFGIAVGQASLPYLSELYQEKKISELKNIITNTILNLFFILIPISFYLIFARTPLVRLFFGGQSFDWEATVLTAYTLSCFALSVPIHGAYYFLTRCFYALLDSRTPFFISLFSIIINLFFSLLMILVFKLPVWSLAISFSLSINLNVFLLYVFLNKKINGLNHRTLFYETLKIALTSFFSAFINYFLLKLLDGLIFDTTRTFNLFLLIGIISISYFLLYFFLCWLLNIKEIFIITKLLIKVKEYQKKILEVYSQYE